MPTSRERQPRFYRPQEIHRIRTGLERDGYPRLQMFLLVTITGAAGFVASFGLLAAGMMQMWSRYLTALGIAYLVFLLLLWLWLRTRAEHYTDLPLPSGGGGDAPHAGADACGARFEGGGGTFDGGGASGDYGVADSGIGEVLGTAAEAEEFAIPLVALVMLAALLLSSLWIVYAAPLLFAELLVDGVLAASLYRRLRGLASRHWLETAIRKTIVPFLLTAVMVALCGWGMAQYAPGAHSIGEVLHARG